MVNRLDKYSQVSASIVDSGSDLANYLELRDIEDELTSLMKLFKEQTTVLQSMINQWTGIMARLNRKLSSKERLTETKNRIAAYKSEVQNMMADCRTAQDAVRLIDLTESV